MADVNTAIYSPLQTQQQPALGPLQVLQMIGQLNQNQLFSQELQSRQAIGDAYKASNDPVTGLNTQKLRSLLPNVGYHAPEAVSQGISNESAAADRDSKYQQILRSTVGALASKPVITSSDLSSAKTAAAAAGVPSEIVQDYFSKVPRVSSAKDMGKVKEFAVTQSNLARGPEAVAGATAGPVDEGGVRPEISQGEASYRRAGVNPEAPDTSATPGQTGMRTELPKGAGIRLETAGQRMADSQARAGNYGADIFPMEQALTNLQKLGPTGTGAGKAEINTIKNFVQANLGWLPGADKIVGNPEDIKNFDEATKYLTNIAGARASAFGHGTDQALSTALTATPNTHISNLAAVDLTKATIALRRMDQVQALELGDKKVSEAQYPGWAAKWATTVDPRAFMIDKMDKNQLEGVEKTLDTPEKRRRFNMSVKKAVDAGVLELPQ